MNNHPVVLMAPGTRPLGVDPVPPALALSAALYVGGSLLIKDR